MFMFINKTFLTKKILVNFIIYNFLLDLKVTTVIPIYVNYTDNFIIDKIISFKYIITFISVTLCMRRIQ